MNAMTVPEDCQGRELKCTECGTPFRIERTEGVGLPTIRAFTVTVRLPPAYWGFLVAGLLMAIQLADSTYGNLSEVALLLVIFGWIFWLDCIHRLHEALQEGTGGRHPISPRKAAFYHFIPFFNLYWFFRWPSEFARTLRVQQGAERVAGGVPGVLVMLGHGMLGDWFTAVAGLVLLFTVYGYYRARLRKLFEFEGG